MAVALRNYTIYFISVVGDNTVDVSGHTTPGTSACCVELGGGEHIGPDFGPRLGGTHILNTRYMMLPMMLLMARPVPEHGLP